MAGYKLVCWQGEPIDRRFTVDGLDNAGMFFIRIAGFETRQLNQAAKHHRLVFVLGDQAHLVAFVVMIARLHFSLRVEHAHVILSPN